MRPSWPRSPSTWTPPPAAAAGWCWWRRARHRQDPAGRGAAAQATARGAPVLWGRCWEGEGAPAFWPWVQVVRTYVETADVEALRQDRGAGAADIAQVVPTIRDRLPDLPAPPPVEPEAARFRLFDSLASFLQAAAARRPLLLVLDDLHWADAPSLALPRFLGRELEGAGLLVLGIYRHTEVDRGHLLLGTLADLTRGRHHRRLLLGGLDQREVAGSWTGSRN